MTDSKIHLPTTVTNIKSAIPITLDFESAQYNNWATLFQIHARPNLVIDHIIPPATTQPSSQTPPKTNAESAAEKAQWDRLDNIVRQWIYATISNNILNTIIDPNDTAHDAWNRLADLFQDNKVSRAVMLEKEFTTTHLSNFPDVNAFIQRLKTLADQLANVGAKVSDARLVLCLLGGLTETYSNFVTVFQNKKPLSSFATACSMIRLEETTAIERAKLESSSNTALVMNSNNSTSDNGQQDHSSQHRNSNNRPKKTNYKGRGGGNSRNRSGGRGGADNRNQPRQQ
ncbi:uncharacterized protein LOC133800362 [Humulus lupulus]|uniref:uncharacterized protein LOC133800362 n=1 Tax=Humulus lupulus TaxID=3486 RepID=UPI002B41544C|nr:uncharacterized protein LOC133800362 [Humulus lupulus]